MARNLFAASLLFIGSVLASMMLRGRKARRQSLYHSLSDDEQSDAKRKFLEKRRQSSAAFAARWNTLSLPQREGLQRVIREGKQAIARKLKWAETHGLHVCVDFGFENSGLEVQYRARQCANAYFTIKHAERPIRLHISSLRSASCNGSIEALERYGLKNWKVGKHEQDPRVVFIDRVVYLTPDAQDPIMRFDPTCVYVVGEVGAARKGGKALTMAEASAHGVQSFRLPIAEYGPAIHRFNKRVLDVGCVISIIATYQELGDWTQTLERTLPRRKSKATAKTRMDSEMHFKRWIERERGLGTEQELE
jgi:hypothetical protein